MYVLVNRFPPADVAAKVAVSLGIGLLVGIEREWSNKDLGIRTFALTSLLGSLSVLYAPSLTIVSLVGVLVIVVSANARSLMVDRSLEATTSTALIVMFVLGALVGQGHLFTPVASAILMTMLLAWKVELHRFAGGLQPAEVRSAVLLGLLSFVIYPILPGRFIDRWNLINPKQVWLTVIVIAGIGFVNYVLLKVYGTKGLYLSGFLGGSVNSTAAAAELAKPLAARGISSGVAVAALLLTIIAMFVRNLIILAIFAPSAVSTAAIPILTMTILALIFVHRSRTGSEEVSTEISLESPVSLKRVLSFAVLFLMIQIISTLSERHLGRVGFLGTSALGGLVSSASTSAAVANMVGHGEMQKGLAGIAVVLASIASAIVNLPIVHRNTGNREVSRRIAVLTLALSAVGIAVLLLENRYHPFGI